MRRLYGSVPAHARLASCLLSPSIPSLCWQVNIATRRWFLQDEQESVYALTDNWGVIMEGYEYDPYGAVTVYQPGSTTVTFTASDTIATPDDAQTRFLYTGRAFDAETGLHYYRTRYLSSELGRFISRDTIGVWGDPNSLGNGYAYVSNEPGNRIDALGTYACDRDAYGDRCDICPTPWTEDSDYQYIGADEFCKMEPQCPGQEPYTRCDSEGSPGEITLQTTIVSPEPKINGATPGPGEGCVGATAAVGVGAGGKLCAMAEGTCLDTSYGFGLGGEAGPSGGRSDFQSGRRTRNQHTLELFFFKFDFNRGGEAEALPGRLARPRP